MNHWQAVEDTWWHEYVCPETGKKYMRMLPIYANDNERLMLWNRR